MQDSFPADLCSIILNVKLLVKVPLVKVRQDAQQEAACIIG